jgi:hypothetical protein
LYNLREDIGEDHNLADALPAETRRLKEMLAEWRIKVGAKTPQPNPDFRKA